MVKRKVERKYERLLDFSVSTLPATGHLQLNCGLWVRVQRSHGLITTWLHTLKLSNNSQIQS